MNGLYEYNPAVVWQLLLQLNWTFKLCSDMHIEQHKKGTETVHNFKLSSKAVFKENPTKAFLEYHFDFHLHH